MFRSILPSVLLCGGFLLICDVAAHGQTQVGIRTDEQPDQQEVQELKSGLEEMNARLSALESRPGAYLGVTPEAKAGDVTDLGNMNDRQTPAARYGNLALDPDLRGFFPVFGASMLLKLNAKPRVDAIWDDKQPGNGDRFVPAHFPLPGDSDYGGGGQFNATANATQLIFEARDPDNPNDFRFYYQNDFFGGTNENMRFRLQHLYGQRKNFLAGFTYGVFEDPDIWPDTVDYEGPNALIFARRPVFHFKARLADEVTATVGIEQPDIYLDKTAAPDASLGTHAPDTGFNVRWERRGTGHAQGSAIFRSISVHGPGIEDQDVFGWGANFSLGLDIAESANFGVLFVGGEGIGGLGNDTSFLNSDAAVDADGDLVALPYYSAMGSFRQRWTQEVRSTATYGYVSLDSVDGQTGDAYETSQYASLNLIYNFVPQATLGLEVLYGDKSVRDGRDTDELRVQFGLAYSLF